MAFATALDRIREPTLRSVAAFWNEARGRRQMPAWSDLRIESLGAAAPYVWAFRHDYVSGHLVGRMAGEKIIAAHGDDPQGKRDVDFFRSPGADLTIERLRLTVLKAQILHCRGPIHSFERIVGHAERLVLPLSDDGVHADGLLGVTVHTMVEPSVADGPTGRIPHLDEVDFIPLTSAAL